MASNTFDWTNNSRVLESMLNDSQNLTSDTATQHVYDHRLTLLVICALGLPGNILVIAVYIATMTSSTKVYMFALAVTDTAICVCGIVLTIGETHPVALAVFFCVISACVNLQTIILVFVSMERLIAVTRPLSFSMDPRRAKVVLGNMSAIVIVYTTMSTSAALMGYELFYMVIQLGVLFSSILTMIVCYTATMVAMLKRIIVSRNVVRVLLHDQSLSQVELSNKITSPELCDVGSSSVSANVTANSRRSVRNKPTPANSSKQLTARKCKKSMLLLFIVTVVYILCWVPMLLLVVGVPVPVDVSRAFVLNSVANPFIYGVASSMFREDVRRFYRQTCSKLSAFYQ